MKKLLIFIITFSFYYISFAQTTVVALEYYIDEDPGLGLGTSIALSPDTEVTVDQSLDLSALALPLGTHTIYVRSQDSNGKWSFYEGRRFLISDAANPVPRAIPNIVNAEYFIDEDPGIGLGTAISFTSATAIETGISIDIPGLSLAIGRHTIYVRAQDANGSWSLFEGRAFLINEGANVATPVVADAVELEYFIDEDPGIGNAQNITISTGAAPSVDFVVPLDIEAGWHSIFVRSKNVDEKWGVYEQRRFLVQEPIISSTSNTDIVMIEYFFNADPGLGNGAQIEVGPNQDLDLSDLELASLGTLPVGMNYVTIRAQNADGNWGFYETREFEVIDDCTQPVAGFDMVLACNGSQSTFTNTSTNLQDDATYKWYLNGDAVEDMTTADAAHIYDFPGTYSVGLAVRQGQICLDSIGYEFVIKESPTVFFSADPSITGQPSQIIVEQFNVTEDFTWSWDFDEDGAEDSAEAGNVEHTLPAVGLHNVTVTLNDALGCETTYSKEIESITGTGGGSEPVIVFDPNDKTYGDVNYDLSATSTTEGTFRFVSSDETVISIVDNTVTINGVGTSTITAQLISTLDVLLGETEREILINKHLLVVSIEDTERAFGDENPEALLSFEGFVNDETSAVIDELPSAIFGTEQSSVAGDYLIELSGGFDDNYELLLINGQLTVLPEPLIVFSLINKTYGDEAFQLSATSTTQGTMRYVSSADTVISIQNSLATILSAGASTITAQLLSSDDVILTQLALEMVIDKQLLIVEVEDLERAFGDENPEALLSFEGFVNDETSAVIDELPSAIFGTEQSSVAGDYLIELSGGFDDNYELLLINGQLTVLPEPLIVFSLINKTYGDEAFQLSATSTTEGTMLYVSSDETVISIENDTATILSVGASTITAQLLSPDDVTLTQLALEMVIDKQLLIVKVEDLERTYGAENPEALFSFDGFVNDDNSTVIDELPAVVFEAGQSSGVGEYIIELISGTDDNYELLPLDAELTVLPAPLTITADNQSMDRTSSLPELTVSYEGFVNEEDASVVTDINLITQASSNSPAGTYDIFIQGGLSSNYTLDFVSGLLTINEILGIAQNSVDREMLIYPNPSSSTFRLLNDHNVQSVQIYDLLGKQVKRFNSGISEFNISDLKSGRYLLKIMTNEDQLHYDLIKN